MSFRNRLTCRTDCGMIAARPHRKRYFTGVPKPQMVNPASNGTERKSAHVTYGSRSGFTPPVNRGTQKWGFHSATRATARLLVGTVLLLGMISTLAQLAGCHVTRATATAAAPPAPQPIDCGTWVDCA